MSQVMVWKSDQDGKLFEDKTKYRKHLRKLAQVRATSRKAAKVEASRDDFQNKIGAVGSLAELTQLIKDNWDWFYANGLSKNNWRPSKNDTLKHGYVGVSFHNMGYGFQSNSHYCPKNGVTNWDRRNAKPGTPTGYPGWRGTINIKVKTQKHGNYYRSGFGSDYFSRTIINTGSGGGGGVTDGVTSYSYEVVLWAEEFPGLVKQMDQETMWKDLGGQIKETNYAVY